MLFTNCTEDHTFAVMYCVITDALHLWAVRYTFFGNARQAPTHPQLRERSNPALLSSYFEPHSQSGIYIIDLRLLPQIYLGSTMSHRASCRSYTNVSLPDQHSKPLRFSPKVCIQLSHRGTVVICARTGQHGTCLSAEVEFFRRKGEEEFHAGWTDQTMNGLVASEEYERSAITVRSCD